MTKTDSLRIFERNILILMKIHEPVLEVDGEEKRIDFELDELNEEANIARYGESRRLAWLGQQNISASASRSSGRITHSNSVSNIFCGNNDNYYKSGKHKLLAKPI